MNNRIKALFLSILVVLLTGCGSSKNISSQTDGSISDGMAQQSQTSFLQKVYANEVYVKNIVADLDFTLTSGSKDINVGGSLRMRRDDVIRIQLVAFGLMEVGRLEFTPEYVLIQDRIHKQYCKADYTKVSFLKENGLDFYALQALLWNQLYLPGSKRVTESSLDEFTLTEGTPNTITLLRDNFTYQWNANAESALIENVNVGYKSSRSGTTNVECKYSRFTSVGNKKFPANIQLNLQTTALQPAKNLGLGFKLSNINNSDKWESRTTPSAKYTEIGVEQLLKNLMTLQK